MVRSAVHRHLLREGALVKRGLVRADGESRHLSAQMSCHQGSDQTRVEATGQKRSHGYVADEMTPDGIIQSLLQLRNPVALRPSMIVTIMERPVGTDGQLAPVPGQAVTSREFLNATKHGERRRHESQAEIVIDGDRLGFCGDVAVREESLHLRSKQKTATSFSIEKRLLAEAVPCGKESLGLRIPDGEGEHTPEACETSLSITLVQLEQHFRVAGCAEPVSGSFELRPKFPVVVDLAIEGDPAGSIITAEGLAAGAKVDDGEPTMTEHGILVGMEVGVIRTPVRERVHHGPHPRPLPIHHPTDHATDATHVQATP